MFATNVFNLFKNNSTPYQYSATTLRVIGTEDKRIVFSKFHEYNPIERASDFSISSEEISVTTEEGLCECMIDEKCKLFVQNLLGQGFNIDFKK